VAVTTTTTVAVTTTAAVTMAAAKRIVLCTLKKTQDYILRLFLFDCLMICKKQLSKNCGNAHQNGEKKLAFSVKIVYYSKEIYAGGPAQFSGKSRVPSDFVVPDLYEFCG